MMPTNDKQTTPKPTPASEDISEGHGSISDIQDVGQDAAEGHPPPVQPQSPQQVVNVGTSGDKPKKD